MKFLRPLFIFFALVALSALASAGKGPGCTRYTTCTTCTPHANCGWCESTSQCLFGNAVGAGGNPSNCTEWLYNTCVVVDCANFKSCQTCVNDQFCGFCLSTNLCVTGDQYGPIQGTCNNFVAPGSKKCPSATPSRTRTPTRSRTRTPTRSRTRTPTRKIPTRTHTARARSSNPARSHSRTPSNSVFILTSSPAFFLAPSFFSAAIFAVASIVLVYLIIVLYIHVTTT